MASVRKAVLQPSVMEGDRGWPARRAWAKALHSKRKKSGKYGPLGFVAGEIGEAAADAGGGESVGGFFKADLAVDLDGGVGGEDGAELHEKRG